MKQISNIFRHIPKEDVQAVSERLGGGTLRGRGPRVHDGRRYFQSLPKSLSERFTLYQGYQYHRQYFDYAGVDDYGRVHIRYNQAESR